MDHNYAANKGKEALDLGFFRNRRIKWFEFIVLTLLSIYVQGSTKMAGDCPPQWRLQESKSHIHEWMAAGMAGMGACGRIKSAPAPITMNAMQIA